MRALFQPRNVGMTSSLGLSIGECFYIMAPFTRIKILQSMLVNNTVISHIFRMRLYGSKIFYPDLVQKMFG